jgi:hypothetical protein
VSEAELMTDIDTLARWVERQGWIAAFDSRYGQSYSVPLSCELGRQTFNATFGRQPNAKEETNGM